MNIAYWEEGVTYNFDIDVVAANNDLLADQLHYYYYCYMMEMMPYLIVSLVVLVDLTYPLLAP